MRTAAHPVKRFSKMRVRAPSTPQNTQAMDKPVNIVIEGHVLSGARQMLLKIMESYNLSPKVKGGKDDAIYTRAELDLVLSSKDCTRKFLQGDRIGYRNHKRNAKGKLVSCEAYWID